ncbi:MAG: hypothetical protein AAFX06_03595 [Planctomycetota bacterium]
MGDIIGADRDNSLPETIHMDSAQPSRRRVSRLVYAIILAMFIGFLGISLATYRVVKFARELPDRFVFQLDGEVIRDAINGSVLSALTNGEDEQRLEVLKQLSAGPIEEPEYRDWVDAQFGEAIAQLIGHPNLDVAGQAARLQASIGGTPPAE